MQKWNKTNKNKIRGYSKTKHKWDKVHLKEDKVLLDWTLSGKLFQSLMADGAKELKEELVWETGWKMELELTERIRFVIEVTLELGRNENGMWPFKML